MRCEEIRRALPLLGGTPDEELGVREHLEGCVECQSLFAAYEADSSALSALRAERDQAPDIMAGFADTLMQRIAEEPAPAAGAEILQPEFGRTSNLSILLAVAAALLVALGVGILQSGTEVSDPSSVIAELPQAPPAPVSPAPEPVDPPLAAPRRARERAPMPRLKRRHRGGIMTVDGSRRPTPPLLNMLRDLQHVFPNWGPNGLDRRVPPLREGEREVRF